MTMLTSGQGRVPSYLVSWTPEGIGEGEPSEGAQVHVNCPIRGGSAGVGPSASGCGWIALARC